MNLLPLLTLILLVAAHNLTRTCMTISGVMHTFYGFPDNDPPGPAIALNCGRGLTAGGTGSYSDPLTFASAPNEFIPCEVIYDPYLRKYLRYEDHCADCTVHWQQGLVHVDVRTGSVHTGGGDDQILCEFALTSDAQTIVRNPHPGLPAVGKYPPVLVPEAC